MEAGMAKAGRKEGWLAAGGWVGGSHVSNKAGGMAFLAAHEMEKNSKFSL